MLWYGLKHSGWCCEGISWETLFWKNVLGTPHLSEWAFFWHFNDYFGSPIDLSCRSPVRAINKTHLAIVEEVGESALARSAKKIFGGSAY